MNRVILIGNLTRDPESAATAAGLARCRFTVATDRRSKEKITDYHDVVAFGRNAEICGQYLHKGSKVAVVGELQYSTYEQDGVKKTKAGIIVSTVELLDKKPEKQEQIRAKDLDDYSGDLPF